MNHEEIIFSSELLDSPFERLLDKWKYYIGIILIVDWFIIISIENVMFIIIYIILIVMVSIYFFIRFKRNDHGKLFVSLKELQVDRGPKELSFKLAEMKKLEISRSSRYHYDYQVDNEEKQSGNFIKFTQGKDRYEYEFLIDSPSMNERFEELVQKLMDSGLKFDYKSV